MEYPRNPSDVYHVAFLLRQKLVADLVPIVLDEAQYWTRRRVSTERAVTVSDAPEGKRVLRTEPLAAQEHRRVRLIRFTTRSVAQCFDRSIWDRPQSPSCGNCGESKQLGACDGTETTDTAAAAVASPATNTSNITTSSTTTAATTTTTDLAKDGKPVDAKADSNKDEAFTWFEAHVGNFAAPDYLYPDTTSRHPDATRVGAPRAADQLPEQGPRLIGNCNTEEELCTYEAEWRFDAVNKHEKMMVRSMKEGDVVDLTAHCSVFGWENFLKHAAVEMFFGYIR